MNAQLRAKLVWNSLVPAILVVFVVALSMGMVSRNSGLKEAIQPPPAEAIIASPCEGIFLVSEYAGGDPLVQPGDAVGEETVVAYIQSMDQTPVKAGVAGTIVEVMFEDMNPVSKGDALFRVELE